MTICKKLIFSIFLGLMTSGCVSIYQPKTIFSSEYKVRIIEFSGLSWRVKVKPEKWGPGPNYFSDSEKNVWTDQQGRLHLRIIRHANKWYCAEVVCTRSFGYGEYRFFIDSDLNQLDQNIVLGLFTWDHNPLFGNREIDIEFSRWSDTGNFAAQYVVQNGAEFDRKNTFDIKGARGKTLHVFKWTQQAVVFESYNGFKKEDKNNIQRWVYDGVGIPRIGNESTRMNLWLFQGIPPTNFEEAEIIIEKFEFVPL